MENNDWNLSVMKVLLVDDTPANIDVLKKTLQPEGYEISIAPNGKIALSIVGRVMPDLILLDVMMPEMDGFETCRRLKENPATRDIPVIFITAKTETEDIVKGFELGGVDYIAKPFRREEVCARARTHLLLRASGKKLEAQNQKLRELDDLKNKFLGMAAHDLRNPLTSIIGFSSVLTSDYEGFSPDEHKQYTGIIESSSKKMLALVNNLLDISVIESGNLRLQIDPNSLAKAIRERMAIFDFHASKKDISLHASLEEIQDFPFDKDQICQVLDNLIGNAIKFSPKGSKVHVSLGKEGNGATVRVQDEGPGLSEEDRTKLFGTFQKLSAKPTGGEKSTGLGLAIAKKIVEAHGGAIGTENPSGPGTLFRFSLPMG